MSGGTGLLRVATPGSGDPAALPPSVSAAIAALDAEGGSDPAGAHLLIGGTGAGEDSAADDPCSPETGEIPAGCPDGLHSAIFADTSPPELEVWPVADVATDPAGTSIFCPGLAPGDGELGLGVGTSVPASVTVRYWPVANPADVRTVTPVAETSQVAAWNARVAATGTYPANEFVFQHCGLLTGLLPHTDYRLSAVAIDDEFMRISEPVERLFSSDGQPTIPPLRAVPLTSSLLYVSAPNYGSANPPIVYAWVVPEGRAADCSAFDTSHAGLQTVQPSRLVEVSAAYLHAHNYASGYNHAVVNLYDAPEGSTIVVCARWYRGGAPSWDRDTPIRQEFLVVASPDSVVPVVTLKRVVFATGAAAYSSEIKASTQTGIECARVPFPSADAPRGSILEINQPLCNVASYASWMAPPGAGGNIVISSNTRRDGVERRALYVLPLNRYRCIGTCDLPPTLTYSVPLPLVTVGSGLCGTGFGGDCTPPTRETALGTAEFEVTWVQGNVTGLDHWVVGTSDNTTPERPPAPDAPRFDAERYVETTLSTDGWYGTARFLLRSDRHVTYTASIAGDCYVGTPPAAVTGQTTLFPSFEGVTTATVSFGGLCPGRDYAVTVELVDDAGHRTVAGASRDAGTVWWPGSIATVPTRFYAVTGSLQITTDPSFYRPWYVVGGEVYLNTTSSSGAHLDFGTDRCFTATESTTTGTLDDATTVQIPTVHVRLYARVQAEALYYGVNHDADCSWPGAGNYVADEELDVSWADLARGVTVTGDMPRSGLTPSPGFGPQIHYRLFVRLGPVRP